MRPTVLYVSPCREMKRPQKASNIQKLLQVTTSIKKKQHRYLSRLTPILAARKHAHLRDMAKALSHCAAPVAPYTLTFTSIHPSLSFYYVDNVLARKCGLQGLCRIVLLGSDHCIVQLAGHRVLSV